MNKQQFHNLVTKEADHIKSFATKEEINKLDFKRLDPVCVLTCIYGQMTGSCGNERAREITPKTLPFISNARLLPETTDEWLLRIEKEYHSHQAFTPIEAYIVLTDSNNKGLIDYIKGKTNTLNL